MPEALVVGASGFTDEREYYSNFGACVDVFAPGRNITSAYNWDDSAFGRMSGTSMATPHVARAAALYLQRNPIASPAQVAAAITGTATADVVKDPGIWSPNRLVFTAALGDTTAPTISLSRPLHGASVRGRVTLTASVHDDVEIKKVVFFAGKTQLGAIPRLPERWCYTIAVPRRVEGEQRNVRKLGPAGNRVDPHGKSVHSCSAWRRRIRPGATRVCRAPFECGTPRGADHDRQDSQRRRRATGS